MRKILIVFLCLLNYSGFAQNKTFIVDTTFKPYFDIRNQIAPSMSDIYENPTDGRIYIGGDFESYYGSTPYQGSVCYHRDGSLFNAYSFQFSPRRIGSIVRVNDTIFAFTVIYNTVLRDTLGNGIGYQWRLNYLKSVKCGRGGYFFSDGSSLFANGDDNWGVPCPIINPPDTFPGRYIIKLTPQGLWDSTFVPDANDAPDGFFRYDSNRIIIYGTQHKFKVYDGVAVNAMCRIYLDGTIDTSFHSPLLDTNTFGIARPVLVDTDGSFFIIGRFLLKDSSHYSSLAKIHKDGTLDTTFMNFGAASNSFTAGVNDIAPTDDGGYLIGGSFTSYQGYFKNGIVKVDSNGKVEPQYFTAAGPDSGDFKGVEQPAGVSQILKSKFGGYYVTGNFLKWDGKPVQPIVRLKLVNTTGINENERTKADVKVYPNPTNESIYIQLLGQHKIQELQLLTAYGKLVQRKWQLHNKKNIHLKLNHLKAGIYFIRMELDNGEMVNKKIIKL